MCVRRTPSIQETATMSTDASAPTEPVLLITGASSGIGAATARLARKAGWRLVLAARSLDRLEDLAEELGGPETALAVRCDVTDWEDQQRMVQSALDAFEGTDDALCKCGFT